MGIKGFRVREKLRPLVDVQIGANVPVGCQNHPCYADSPDDNKCVDHEGDCRFIATEQTVFKRGGKARFCPMPRLNEKELEAKGSRTRPTQLGYFKIPAEYKEQLGLPDRPTELPGICVISDWNIEQNGMVEPVEVIHKYPILDYYLSWWTASACICKGDGEIANYYPFSPSHEKHMQQRACAFKDCPDFGKNEGRKFAQCKAVGELYFRLPNTPGYPGLWRFTTRSSTAIETMIMQLEQIHTAFGGVISRLPLKLVLKEVSARYDDGQGGTRSTKVHRVHIETEITMQEAFAFRNEVKKQLVTGEEIRMITDSTPAVVPPGTVPVEVQATADPSEWDQTDVPAEVEKKAPPAAKPPAQSKPKPAAPAQKEKPADTIAAVLADRHEEAQGIENMIIAGLELCKDQSELTAFMTKHKSDFVPFKDLGYPKNAGRIYKELVEKLPKKLAPVKEQPPADGPPDPEPPADVAEKAQNKQKPAPAAQTQKAAEKPAGGELMMLRAEIKGMCNQSPPVFDESAAIDMIANRRVGMGNNEAPKSINDFTIEEMNELKTLAEQE